MHIMVTQWGSNFSSVACGFAHSMVVIDRTNIGDRLDQVDTSLFFSNRL